MSSIYPKGHPLGPASTVDQTPDNIEELWSQGKHVNSKGEEIDIADLPSKYLQNIINHFAALGKNTSSLQTVLDGRKDQ